MNLNSVYNRFFFVFVLFLSSGYQVSLFGQDLQDIPDLRSRVIDTVQLLTLEQKNTLERKLYTLERSKGIQIACLILSSTKPEDIESYSIRVAEKWKLGRKNVDDGVIVVIAKDDRRIRIEVGYGLEGALTDIVSHRIITDIISPHFKKGDFYEGIQNGLHAVSQVVQGEDLPKSQFSAKGKMKRGRGKGIFLLVGLLLLTNVIIRSLFGSGISFFLNLVLGLLLGYIFFSWLSGLMMALLASLAGPGIGSRGFIGGMGYGYGGGMAGGSFGSGGGGFSGGGGGFGGGGASGSW